MGQAQGYGGGNPYGAAYGGAGQMGPRAVGYPTQFQQPNPYQQYQINPHQFMNPYMAAQQQQHPQGMMNPYYGQHQGMMNPYQQQQQMNPFQPQAGAFPPQQQAQSPYQPNSSNKYGLSPIEHNIIQSYFATIAGIDQKLDRQEFSTLIAKLYPQLNGQNLQSVSERAFQSIDSNGDGYISLEEFIAAYVNLKGQNIM